MSEPSAYDEIRRAVLGRLERDRLDPDVDPAAVRAIVAGMVADYQRRAQLGQGRALGNTDEMLDRILRSVTAFGPLTELLARTDVEEIFIEGPRVTYLDADGRLQGLTVPTTTEENRAVVDRLLASTQRTLDSRTPLVQARVLDGGARLTASQSPISDELSATLRRHRFKRESLSQMVALGSLPRSAAGFLWALMQTTTGVVVSGPPGAGKTSMLSAMIAAAPSNLCIRCAEEIRELHIPLAHGGYYEARPPGADGTGEVDLRAIVKFLLAMRPDRIVVGEVRGEEAFELTRAVNAGCGFSCTVHANSGRDALTALVNAALMAGENVRDQVVRRIFASSIDVVVHCDRDEQQVQGESRILREVTEIVAVVPSMTDDFSTEPVFVRDGMGKPMRWTGFLPPDHGRLQRALPDGLSLRAILEDRVSPL